jgi:hypothetical protein
MYFAANLLSFLIPTHRHDFGNHNDGYGHSKAILMQSLADSRKSDLSMVLNFETFSGIGEDYDF